MDGKPAEGYFMTNAMISEPLAAMTFKGREGENYVPG